MKKIVLAYFALALLLPGCVDDKGNYDYREMIRVEIAPLPEPGEVAQMSTLHIEPQITFSDPSYTADDFDYLWVLVGSKTDTLSRERILDVELRQTPTEYTLYFKVTDRESGLSSIENVKLKIINEDVVGYTILSNVDGYAELAIVSANGNRKRNVFETINNKKAGRNPVGLHYSVGMLNSLPLFYILCDDDQTGGSITSPIDFSETSTVYNNFIFKPERMRPGKRMHCYGISILELMVNDGVLYTRNTNSKELKYVTAPAKTDFEVSEFMFSDWSMRLVVWDKTNRRFQKFVSTQTLEVIDMDEQPDDAPFDVTNVGMDMIDGTLVGRGGATVEFRDNGRAVMRADNGDIYLLGFGYDPMGTSFTAQSKFNVSTHEGITRATNFAIKAEGEFVFYSFDGHKIGTSSFSTGNSMRVNDDLIPAGLTIDCMRVDQLYDRHELYVTANDGSGRFDSGSLFVFNVGTDGMLTLKEKYMNCCGQVVDVMYKN